MFIQRIQAKDFVSIHSCEGNWNCVRRFEIDSIDADGLAWSPDNRTIAIYETFFEYKIMFYSPDGRMLRKEHRPTNETMCMGIQTLKWSPSSQLLAVGSYDHKIAFYNCYTFKNSLEFELSPIQRPEDGIKLVTFQATIVEAVMDEVNIPTLKLEDKNALKYGVGHISFNKEGTFVAARDCKKEIAT
ncbi:hypothetical protein O9G_003012 [Rozella allomycis CSF55]|uniref:WD40 repeat-like protein n=1 Tax=Rozella allomycis (strain CSF55) TaxID=988480 RepID=A0A075B007_ROZAC|nr:hypothetical protein O9G_003012 [Rozella allomycis CSF55]|eukprot:EPZ34292.1 hypothetical protein O9G_003012 [Rozella allomycis CSF55]